jgi:tRNA-dihydrouridine synthase B
MGADIVISEFLSSEAIRRRIRNTLEGAEFEEVERPIGIQIYGADPNGMAEAAGLITEHYRPEFIDINFGCPVKKVVQRNGGSGCLRDLGLVDRIIRAVIGATHLPVTVKTRSGWSDEQRDPVTIALRMQDAGARAFTLHARTRTQMFSGKADWDEIARVVEALDIPVIGNGDLASASDIVRMREHTGCAGVMVGRGAFGNPWIFRDGRMLLAGGAAPGMPDARERFAVALEHARLALRLQGDTRKTVVEFRKHLGWYTRGLHGASELRQRLFQIESIAEAEAIFLQYLEPVAQVA